METYATLGVGSRCRGGSFNNNNPNNLRVDNRNDNNNPSNNNVGFRAANTPRSGELLGESAHFTDRDVGSVPGESMRIGVRVSVERCAFSVPGPKTQPPGEGW